MENGRATVTRPKGSNFNIAPRSARLRVNRADNHPLFDIGQQSRSILDKGRANDNYSWEFTHLLFDHWFKASTD
jgi:hypothetical protein